MKLDTGKNLTSPFDLIIYFETLYYKYIQGLISDSVGKMHIDYV